MSQTTDPGDAARLAQLKLEAAQAAAAAAQARADAAAAQAEAAAAALAAAEQAAGAAAPAAPPAASPATAPAAPAPAAAPAAPTPAADASAAPSELAAQIAAGYTFAGPMLALGALLEDGVPRPEAQVGLPLGMLNRHGLVAGATGTGKTRTLQLMAESLSAAGVPAFVADVKGDLTGLATPGTPSEKLTARTQALGQQWSPAGFPVEFYALGGLGHGVPVRTTISEFGPLLLSKVLGLNETQESSLGLIFHWADSQRLALLDLADLRATVAWLASDDGKNELKGIGGLSPATAGVILRELVALEAQGADAFFGEPAFAVTDLLRLAPDGRGVISALELPAVQDRPALFSTFLMWLLAELFEALPEVGDPEKPKLVFFFDEAHLLFADASKAFLDTVVRTVRLIRSKGVGIVFVTQSPKDVPADVLGQLGSRVQHALRAFTPDDAADLRAAARTYPRSSYDLEQVLTQLGTGEAIVTVLGEKGAPTPVAWTRLRAPQASMAAAPDAVVLGAVAASPLASRYAVEVDRESAYELLTARAKQLEEQQEKQEADEKQAKDEAAARKAQRSSSGSRSSSRRAGPLDSLLKSAGTQLGRELTRTIFGTLIKR
jgi:DNA helicase HerA-like ATPase